MRGFTQEELEVLNSAVRPDQSRRMLSASSYSLLEITVIPSEVQDEDKIGISYY
jgi:hypothetical protein